MQTEPIVILAAVGRSCGGCIPTRMALDGGKDRFWLKQLWNMSSDYPAKLLMQGQKGGPRLVPDGGASVPSWTGG